MTYKFTRKELKNRNASDFNDGDYIQVSKYEIQIKYTSRNGLKFKTPLATIVVNLNTCRFLDCTPGVGWPYYIDDFIHR